MYFNNNVYYYTDLKLYQSIRDYMAWNIYSRENYVNDIMSLITSKIDCSDIKFDYMRYEITFTIQKSTMRRVKGYEAKATYYYEVMKSVFWDFFKKYPEIVNNINRYTGIYLTDPSVLDNICQVQCIGDKVVVIKL